MFCEAANCQVNESDHESNLWEKLQLTEVLVVVVFLFCFLDSQCELITAITGAEAEYL